MHTVSISLRGAVNDAVKVELSDSEALPVWVQLKAVLGGSKVSKRGESKKTVPSSLDAQDAKAAQDVDERAGS